MKIQHHGTISRATKIKLLQIYQNNQKNFTPGSYNVKREKREVRRSKGKN
jgi:hypothetical protein